MAQGQGFSRDPILLVLMAAVFSGSLAMMAFVALIGPVAREAGLAPWQAGLTVTASGVMWMLTARPWGAASDRHGRRTILMLGVVGFTLAYWALCLFVDAMLRWQVPAMAGFLGLVLLRGQAMAQLGTGSAAGLVVGPGIAALLVPLGLSVPLVATAALPLLAGLALWWLVPATPPLPGPVRRRLVLTDPRLRQPLLVGFAAMFSVAIAQVSIGFYAMDRLGLPPAEAARAAGTALMLVGVALVISQGVAARVRIAPARMIRLGCLVAALGFASVVLADRAWMLAGCYFVAALGMGWVFPGFTAMAANAVDAAEQGAAQGAAGAAQGLGMVVGPVAGTLLYGVAPALPYVLAGVLLVGVSLPLWRGGVAVAGRALVRWRVRR
jgi:DHA1 family tetracycline resistance protein-like MFS transporter